MLYNEFQFHVIHWYFMANKQLLSTDKQLQLIANDIQWGEDRAAVPIISHIFSETPFPAHIFLFFSPHFPTLSLSPSLSLSLPLSLSKNK